MINVFLGDTQGTLQPLSSSGPPVGAAIPFTCLTPVPLVPLFPAVIT